MINLRKKDKEQKQTGDRIKILLIAIGLTVAVSYYFWEYLDWYFTVFLATAMAQFELGDVGMGILCLVIQVTAWILAGILFKVTVVDTFWPRFRVVTSKKDVYRFARKICNAKGEDPNYMYFMVKFHMFPLLRWHKLKLPRPEYIRVGIPGINRTKKVIDNGMKGITWRRMPAHIDIITDDMHLNFNETEKCYELGLKVDVYRSDDVMQYEELAFKEVKTIGSNIIESVKGDYGLIKDQYHMGIVIREQDLPIPDEEKPDVLKPEAVILKREAKDKVVVKYNGQRRKD